MEESKIDETLNDENNGIQETLVGKGIGNALKVFRERGMLGRDFNRGRTNDITLNQ